MAEVVVVSAVVLMTLSTLYVSYNKIYSLYKARLNYNDVNTLYKLAYYRDSLIKDTNISVAGSQNKMADYISSISDVYVKVDVDGNYYGLHSGEDYDIFLINNNKKNIDANKLNGEDININQTYRDYISYLANSVDLTKTDYVMIMERCIHNEKNDCKYAYLQIDNNQG